MNNLNNLTMKELYVIAKERGIKNIKSLRKAELINTIKFLSSFTDECLVVKQSTLPEATESIPMAIQPEPSNIITKITNAIVETKNKVIEAIQKPFKFRFDSTRANKGDYFTKKIGEIYIPLKVLDKDDKSVIVTTQTGIKLKLIKR